MNCLQAAGLTRGHERLNAKQLLGLPNFGKTSLKDLLLCVEQFLLDCIGNVSYSIGDSARDPSGLPTEQNPSIQVRDGVGRGAEYLGAQPIGAVTWKQIEEALKPILAVMAESGDAVSFSDALSPRLIKIASWLGKMDDLDDIELAEATRGYPGLAVRMAERLRPVLAALPDRHACILERRLLTDPPATLNDVGAELGVTRERVRQIQAKLERRIAQALGEEMGQLASILADGMAPVLPQKDLADAIDKVLRGVREEARPVIELNLVKAMGYTPDGGWYVSANAEASIAGIRDRVRCLADETGVVKEDRLLAELISESPALAEHWDWLLRRCGLHRLHGCVALRNSAKARVMAALLELGRPASRSEIGALCGLTDTRVGGVLSNIKSVARADADHWGLREWIDDEYDGIVGEIIQRIKEDGGATTTKRLISEIPAKFSVSPNSVDAYMKTSRFEIQDGMIRLADPARLRLRPLYEVIDGMDSQGNPYWTFKAEERFLRGYSVTGFPPELAKMLGCKPDGNLMVRCTCGPINKLELSVRWPLASTTGGSLGYSAAALKALDVQPGDSVRVTIIGAGQVSLAKHEPATNQSDADGVEDILRRMKLRRRAL